MAIINSGIPQRFTSIKDIGITAAIFFQNPGIFSGQSINMASEAFTQSKFAAIISKVRGKQIVLKQNHTFFKLFLPNLFKHLDSLYDEFYQKGTTDFKKIHLGVLTVEQFLLKHHFENYKIYPPKKSDLCYHVNLTKTNLILSL